MLKKESAKLFNNAQKAHKWLLKLDKNLSKLVDTKNIKAFLLFLNNPQDQYQTIHVAGTSGKGSTCLMIANILKAAGYKTGLTVSPYLSDFKEKIQINNKYILEQDFINLVNKYRKLILKFKLTYFEAFVALTYVYFYEQKVDFAVIETGLGGRLDATNVLSHPALAVITSIGLDHTEVLGKTKKLIAHEKAGIIVDSKKSITGSKLIKNAKFIDVKNFELNDLRRGRSRPVITDKQIFKYNHKIYQLKMLGEFQIENAILAIESAKFLKIDDKYIKQGLLNAENFGRLTIIKKKPLVIIDGAHNPDKMLAFTNFLKKNINFKNYKNKTLLIAIKYNKDYQNIIKCLVPFFNKIIITTFSQCLNPIILKKAIKKISQADIKIIKNPQIVYKQIFQKINKNDLFVVTGSLYLIGDIFKKA